MVFIYEFAKVEKVQIYLCFHESTIYWFKPSILGNEIILNWMKFILERMKCEFDIKIMFIYFSIFVYTSLSLLSLYTVVSQTFFKEIVKKTTEINHLFLFARMI